MSSSTSSFKWLFGALVLAAMVALLFVRGASPVKVQGLKGNINTNAEVLIFGNSIVHGALHEAPLKGMNTQNLAKHGTGITEYYFKLKNIALSKFSERKLVVVTFKNSELTRMAYVAGANIDKKVRPVITQAEDESILMDKTYFSIRQKLTYALASRFAFFQNRFKWKAGIEKKCKSFGATFFSFLKSEVSQKNRKKIQWSKRITLPKFVEQDFSKTYLHEIYLLGQKEGFDVMVLQNPVNPEIEKSFDRPEVVQYYSDLKAYCDKYGVLFRDANVDDYKFADFTDGSHLTKKGAEKYSAYIKKSLNEYFSEKVGNPHSKMSRAEWIQLKREAEENPEIKSSGPPAGVAPAVTKESWKVKALKKRNDSELTFEQLVEKHCTGLNNLDLERCLMKMRVIIEERK